MSPSCHRMGVLLNRWNLAQAQEQTPTLQTVDRFVCCYFLLSMLLSKKLVASQATSLDTMGNIQSHLHEEMLHPKSLVLLFKS